jgi:peptidoglycan hydrolase-like protein with peptidoglycan-binding domain
MMNESNDERDESSGGIEEWVSPFSRAAVGAARTSFGTRVPEAFVPLPWATASEDSSDSEAGSDSSAYEFVDELEEGETVQLAPEETGLEATGELGEDTELDRAGLESDEVSEPEEWAEEAAGPEANLRGGSLTVDKVPLLRKHAGIGPDLVLAWNDLSGRPAAVDIVVHFHGYSLKSGTRLDIARDVKARSGLDWSDPADAGPAARRTRPTLAILPRGHFFGGQSDRGYNFPAVTAEGGLEKLIAFGLQELATRLGLGGLTRARLLLTAHSGGGAALLRVLSQTDPDEVHAFDALYQSAAALVSWAKSRIARDQQAIGNAPGEYMASRGGALRVLYRAGTARHTLPVAKALNRLLPPDSPLRRWYRVERTATGHVQIPAEFGWRLLVDAGTDLPGVPYAPKASRAREVDLEDLVSDEEDTHEEGEDEELEAGAADEESGTAESLEEEAPWIEREKFRSAPALVYTGVSMAFPSGETLPVVTGPPTGTSEDYWDPTGSGLPLLDTGPAHKGKKLSPSFTVRELTTSGGESADIARIDPRLVECLQRLRDRVGKGITINSGFRSWKRNRALYAARKKTPTRSQHCAGRAADIRIAEMNGLEIGKAAIDAYGPDIGIGLGNTFAHIDVRGLATVWDYGGAPDAWIAEIKRYQRSKGGVTAPPKAAPGTATPAPSAAERVRFAQRALNAAEGERLDDDGKPGPRTRAALERFRQRYGLGAGGTLDDRTEVALVQRALEELAQQSIFGQTGVLDDRTRQELVAFKSARGLGAAPSIDAATRAALSDALAPAAKTPAAAPTAPAASPGTGLTPPSDASAYRPFRLTTYHVADQSEVPTGSVAVPICDDKGAKLAAGSPAFFAQLSLEGTGRLTDGRLINVTGKKIPVSHDDYAGVLDHHRRYLPTRPTAYSGIVVKDGRVTHALAFHEVPAAKRGVGYGSLRGIPLVPFRTLAADIGRTSRSEPTLKGKGGVVPPGTRVYIKEYDGLQLPDGQRHDGWFVVNDTGGGIFGAHFDVFVGTRALRKKLKLPEVGRVWFQGIESRVPPGYEYGLKP